MKLKEFKEFIDKVEDKLLDDGYKAGVCWCISIGTSEGVDFIEEMFNRIMRPRFSRSNMEAKGVDGNYSYWLGNPTLRNLPRRVDTLRFFEQYCISEELYKDF